MSGLDELTTIDGIDDEHIQSLKSSRYDSIESIAKASPTILEIHLSIRISTAVKLVRKAEVLYYEKSRDREQCSA